MKKITFFALITFVLLTYGLHEALVAAPVEATMGDVYRIFYYHVPMAWTALLLAIANCVFSLAYLVRRSPAADALAYGCGELAVVFGSAFLLCGTLWAKPVWGIWWTWDARLTSSLVLWLIYVSYLVLRRYSLPGQNAVLASSLAVFGAVDAVFVFMAIRWFRTPHPQPVILDKRMAYALVVNILAFTAMAGLLLWMRYRLERLREQVEEAHAMEAIAGENR